MKVVYVVCNFDDYGGIEKISMNLAELFVGYFQVFLVSNKSYGYSTKNLKVIDFSKTSSEGVFIVSKKKDLVSLIRLHGLKIIPRILLWRHIPIKRISNSMSGIVLDMFLNLIISTFGKGVISITKRLSNEAAVGFRKNRFRVIHNIIDATSTYTNGIRSGQAIKCLYVHRNDPQKRLDIVEKIAVGMGGRVAFEVRCSSEILNQKSNNENIKYLPYVDDLPSTFCKYDIIVLASEYEGFPTILVEGLSHGVPFLANDCVSGPREICELIGGGIIVPHLNSESYIEKLNEIYECGLSKMNLDWQKFSPMNILNDWIDVIGEEVN